MGIITEISMKKVVKLTNFALVNKGEIRYNIFRLCIGALFFHFRIRSIEMNKKDIFLIVIFLFFVPILCGCGDSKARWTQLYGLDADDMTAESDFKDDDTMDDDLQGTGEVSKDTEQIEDLETLQPVEKKICVHICGAVVSPGVYELPERSRIVQAIEAAGGLTEEADSLLVNQARIVEDGEQIRIFTKEEAKQMEIQSVSETDGATSGKVNINTAAADVLMTLPGIGEAKADAIIAYREQHGGFKTIEDIMNISGIKEAVFSKIRDRITV